MIDDGGRVPIKKTHNSEPKKGYFTNYDWSLYTKVDIAKSDLLQAIFSARIWLEKKERSQILLNNDAILYPDLK